MKKNTSIAFWGTLMMAFLSAGFVHRNGADKIKSPVTVKLVVLGIVQDGGSPHIGCNKECCRLLFDTPDPLRKVVALGLLDLETRSKFLFEATPDIVSQLRMLRKKGDAYFKAVPAPGTDMPDGVFLTHAHIGHYAGLMHLGKEAADAKNVPVYAMPGMKSFLETNGPWSQLVQRNNICLQVLEENKPIPLTPQVEVTPVVVPHRDEYSETVGYIIKGPSKSALFIPDIDKWVKWKSGIADEIRKVDYAFIDATFFNTKEVSNRNISEIPHPLVEESMQLFANLSKKDKNKIWFIHFNHTNPLLRKNSPEAKQVLQKGFHIAEQGLEFDL